MTELDCEILGQGETAILVHGSGARSTWIDQRPLAERYRLVLPSRRGYGLSPPGDPDFEVDGRDIAELAAAVAPDGAHLVGFSYGGIGCLLAAAGAPERILSLTVIEPPCFGVARGDPAVERFLEALGGVYSAARSLTAEEYDAACREVIGARPASGGLKPEQRAVADANRRERPPAEAEVPLAALAAGRFPKLVVSGVWNAAFDAVCAVLAERLGADRALLPGAGHGAHQAPGFNDRLESLWRAASAQAATCRG